MLPMFFGGWILKGRKTMSCAMCTVSIKRENKKFNTSLAWENSQTFRDATTDFPAKWHLKNKHRDSILMTCHYPDLGSAFDWLKQILPNKSTNQGRDPFNLNFRKFRSKTQWIGSVQPEKFRKNGSTFWGEPLLPVGPVGILVKWIAPQGCLPFDRKIRLG